MAARLLGPGCCARRTCAAAGVPCTAVCHAAPAALCLPTLHRPSAGLTLHRSPALHHPQGIKNVPKRLRVVIQRRRAEDDEDSEEMFSVVSLADDQNTKKGVVVLEA